MNCCNPYPCSRGAAGFVRQESRQASSLKAPLPETALAKGLWGACDPLQTKDYWNHPSGEIKRHQEKNPPLLAKMLAPVRLVAAAPPLREASAGGWQRARGQAHINGKENPHTCRWHNGSCGQDLFFFCPSVFFALDWKWILSGKGKKNLFGAIQASPVGTRLPKPVCRGDCRAVVMHLWYIISVLLGKQPFPRGALAA